MELQKDTDNKYKIIEESDKVTIKNEADVQMFTNESTEIVLNSTINGHDVTKPWIKCEAVEELKLDNDFCRITEITEEYTIKNEEDHIIKYPSVAGSHMLNICNHCHVTFKRKRSLDDHIIKQHPDMIAEVSSKIHACAHCKYRTTRKDSLAHHMLKHSGANGGHKLEKCVHCNKRFRWKTTLDDHIIKKHPDNTALVSSKIYVCKFCIYKTTLKSHLFNHMMGKHPGVEGGCQRILCISCSATFSSKVSLDDHIIKNHPESITSVSSKIHACPHCKYKTTRKYRLAHHKVKHPEADGGYKLQNCIHCNVSFTTKRCLDDHIIRKHPDLIVEVSSKIHACAHCKYKTTIKGSLVQHNLLKHPGSEGGYYHKKCVYCNGKFRYTTTLDNHIIQKHPEYSALVSSKILECKYCVFKTTLNRHLVSHMGKHPDAEGDCERTICISCSATFASKVNLDNHIIKKHPECISSVSNKIHECKYCTFKTTKKSDLARHVLNYHRKEGGCELETCIHCDTMFKDKRRLGDHIIQKHPGYISSIPNKVHECIYCMYKTTFKVKLNRHMLTHRDADSSCKPNA